MTHSTSTSAAQRKISPMPAQAASPTFTCPTPPPPLPPPAEGEDTDLSFSSAPEPNDHYDLTLSSLPSTGSSTPSAGPSSGLPLSVDNLARLEACTAVGTDSDDGIVSSLFPGSAEELNLYFERMEKLGQVPGGVLRSQNTQVEVGGRAKSSAAADDGSGRSETGTVCSGEGIWAATLAGRALRDEEGIGRPGGNGERTRRG